MLAPLVALLLAQAAPPPSADPDALPERTAHEKVADRYVLARERLLRGELSEAAAELEAILSDKDAGEYAERAVVLARLAREMAARGRFVPTAPPVPLPGLPARAPEDRGGRAELVLFSTVYGVYAGGATVLAADAQNGRAIASLLLAGGGAGLGTSLWLTRAGPISSGRANAIDSAAVWAGYNGTLLGIICDANFRVAAGISLASSAAGLTTSALLTREAAPRVGTVASANSGGLYGLAAGAFIASMYPGEGSLKPVLTTLLLTADTGLVVGAWFGEEYRVSRERALLVDAGAVVGTLGGLAVFAIIQPDFKEAGGALALTGLGAGVGTALWLTHHWDDEARPAVATSLEVGPWVGPTPDGRVAWGVAGRF